MYHFSKASYPTSNFPSRLLLPGSTTYLLSSAMIASSSCFVGLLCPRRSRSFVISSSSILPSPFVSMLEKTRRTSISTRASLTVYHFVNASKWSRFSLVSVMHFQSSEAAGRPSLMSPSSSRGGCQPRCSMNLTNSASLMCPSPSASISANTSCRLPLNSVTTAMPALSLMLACCVRTWMIPPRKEEGMDMVTLFLSCSCGIPSGRTFLAVSFRSTQSCTGPLNFMKAQ
mmetsp:Transcript_97868/g.292357  ORF Transcript_97868/g.292357 Transcript_97868/m.292357 type:complete len:229 (+) Transcript_97868:146-832(+)